MLITILHFWAFMTNSMNLKCGMLTHTLLDVAAITSLKPTRETFDPNSTLANLKFKFIKAIFTRYISEHHVTDTEEVSDVEHVALLTLWLSHFIFCSRSFQVAKIYVHLAIQLHEG
jgi:hypothetical protein